MDKKQLLYKEMVLESVKKELNNILVETEEKSDNAYDPIADDDKVELQKPRKKVLTLRDIDRLKKVRNDKRDELARESIFVPFLYGPPENPEGEAGGGDLGGMDLGGI